MSIIDGRDNSNPPEEQNQDEDNCPICSIKLIDLADDGMPLYPLPARSRFDDTTLVCCMCEDAESTAYLMTPTIDKTMKRMLSDGSRSKYSWSKIYGLTEWQEHVIRILAIRGAQSGYQHFKQKAHRAMIEKLG